MGRIGADGVYTTSGLPSGTFRVEFAPDLSGTIATAIYRWATVENVQVSGMGMVTGVDVQLVRDPNKVKFLPVVRQS
jgi:hypothetical protein